jgi:hypothetical protein
MHPDTEKLISIARGNGFITRSQREAILNRAKSLGDNLVEVEFILDDIPVKDEPAAPNTQQQNRQQYANAAPQRPAAQQPQDSQKKKKTWLWAGIGGAVAVLIIIIAVASGGNKYDRKLDKLEKCYEQMITDMQNGSFNDENIGSYMDIGKLLLLENELETAYNEGKLSPEQSYRYQQIQSARNMMGVNMFINMLSQ